MATFGGKGIPSEFWEFLMKVIFSYMEIWAKSNNTGFLCSNIV